MDEKMLKALIKLGIIETFQSYFEGGREFNSYYYEEIEETEDDFFREDLKEDN